MTAEQCTPAGSGAAESVRTLVHVPPGRQWTLTTTGGCVTSGYLPGWAEADPSRSGIPLDRLPVDLDGICHRAPFDGRLLHLAPGGYGAGEETVVFAGAIECRPDPDEGRPAGPVVNVHLIEDFWITALDPGGLAEFVAVLRAQADRLEHDVLPRLVSYRQDWADHHSA